jgi:abscisic acid receptor (PYR/PYL family)
VYKSLIQTCDIIHGDGGVGTIREIHLVSSIPATSSIERLEILDHEQHIISFKVLTGGHRLQNYWSVTSLHQHEIDGQMGTLVLESYVVDIPEGNTREETHMFVDTVVRCNLKKLARLSEHKFFHEEKAQKPKDVSPLSLDSHSSSVAVEG